MAIDVAGDTLPATGDGNQLPQPAGEPTPCLSENSVLAFVEGEAGRGQRARVDAHIDQCSMCADLVANAARHGAPPSTRSAPPTHSAPSTASASGYASPPWPTAFAKGSVLAGRFSIIRFVARGGMGEVYEAFDQKVSGRVALKTMLCTLGDSDAAVQRLCEEVKLARRIAHRNVCRIHELHEHHDPRGGAPLLFLAMEFVDGKTLKDCVRGNPLPPRAAGDVAVQLLRGLGAAHDSGVLHLDFKSQNVMLRESRRGHEALIMDFSLSRAFDTEARMHASERQLVGTPGYISPEQLECRTTLGPSSDIYSFGVVFYEMLTGRLPFVGQSPSAVLLLQLSAHAPAPSDVVRGLTAVFDRFVLKCLQRDPRLRFADTASALESLESCLARLDGGPVPALRTQAARLLIVASVSASAAGLLAFVDTKRPIDPRQDVQSVVPELQPSPDPPAKPPESLFPAPPPSVEPGPAPRAEAAVRGPSRSIESTPKRKKPSPSRPKATPAAEVRSPEPEPAPQSKTAKAVPTEPQFEPKNAPAQLY